MNYPERIAEQLRRPGEGFFARMVCKGMARNTAGANDWTISILNVEMADHVLEIGFGPGLAITKVTELNKFGYTAGIDWSKVMVQRACKKNSGLLRNGRLKLEYGDISKGLSFSDNSFDKVFSVHGIYFWPEPAKCLKEIHRVLKPGGLTALTIWSEEKSAKSRVMQTSIFKQYTGDEISLLLKDSKFSHTWILHAKLKYAPAVCVLGKK